MIVPNETAWREEDRDSISVMEKIIDSGGLPEYHFEELEFGGLKQDINWVSANHADGAILTIVNDVCDNRIILKAILSFHALAETGIVLNLRNKERYLTFIESYRSAINDYPCYKRVHSDTFF